QRARAETRDREARLAALALHTPTGATGPVEQARAGWPPRQPDAGGLCRGPARLGGDPRSYWVSGRTAPRQRPVPGYLGRARRNPRLLLPGAMAEAEGRRPPRGDPEGPARRAGPARHLRRRRARFRRLARKGDRQIPERPLRPAQQGSPRGEPRPPAPRGAGR